MLDIVYSAYQAENTDVLARILKLYVRPGASILDMCYGRGTFWKNMPDIYELWTNDIDKTKPSEYHTDARRSGFPSGYFKAVILDPPYAVRRSGNRGTAGWRRQEKRGGPSYDSANGRGRALSAGNIDLYMDCAKEAHRVLAAKGLLIIKAQDEIECSRFKAHHLTLCSIPGFRLEDIFVVVMKWNPVWDPKWKNQNHARKNHSYFIVHRKI